jgi:hypothetical protein
VIITVHAKWCVVRKAGVEKGLGSTRVVLSKAWWGGIGVGWGGCQELPFVWLCQLRP